MGKKVLYIALVNKLSNSSGVCKKIRSQIECLNDRGMQASGLIFYLDNTDDGHITDDCLIRYVCLDRIEKKTGWVGKMERRRILFSEIQKMLLSESYDFVYFRYPSPADMFLFNLVKKFPRRIVFEHQTKELEELWLRTGVSPSYVSECFWGSRVLRYAAGSVAVTNEIGDFQKLRCASLRTRYIGNGCDVASIPLRNHPVFDGTSLRILFLGNVSVWHGLDRFIRGLSGYSGPTAISLYIVGDGPELNTCKELAEKFGLERNIFFCGTMHGHQLDKMFDECHIAIASLGLHRLSMNEGSSLKVREYFSRGIPFIISNDDADLRDSRMRKFYYKADPDESNIEIEKVVQFAEEVLNDTRHSVTMRQLATESLDMKVKMSQLREFLGTL